MVWDGETTRESFRSVPPAQWKSKFVDLFAEDAGPARDIITATTDEIAAFPIYDMPLALRLFANPSAHAWLYAYHIDWSERVA